MPSRLKRILVTGSGGFVGRPAVEALRRQGFDVHGLTSSEVDLLDSSRSAAVVGSLQPTHLLHLAWYTEHGLYWSSPMNDRWVEASMQLFRAFIHAGGKRIIGVGTCAEYDWSGPGILAEGRTPIVPSTLYGRAKARLHEMLDSLCQETGVEHVWARLFFLYGPREAPQRFVPSIIRSLLRNERAICRNGGLQRDFLYVEDAGAALAALADHDGTVGAVNVGSGDSMLLSTMASSIAAKLGMLNQLRVDEAATTEPPRIVADVHRLTTTVRFHPAVGLDEGLERTIAWWRNS